MKRAGELIEAASRPEPEPMSGKPARSEAEELELEADRAELDELLHSVMPRLTAGERRNWCESLLPRWELPVAMSAIKRAPAEQHWPKLASTREIAARIQRKSEVEAEQRRLDAVPRVRMAPEETIRRARMMRYAQKSWIGGELKKAAYPPA